MQNNNVTIKNQVIMFLDIHNYSIAAITLGQSQYEFIQQVYEMLGDIIVAYEGEIIKYMGDGLLCVFPAVLASEAVECAMKLRQAFAGVVRGRNLPGDTELEVGISAGEVAIGVFGHKSLRQKDVFGDKVNCAAMIGHHRGIAITESVYDEIKTRYETARLPDFEPKWQDEPLRVWEIVE